MQIFIFAIVPLTGAVNVFIYTRPAVRHVRRVDPSISRVIAFWMVLKAGGEAPNMEQCSSSTQNQQQQPQPEHSSREPFGRGEHYNGSDFCKGLDSLNVERLGSLEDISEDNVAYRSEEKWSHNLGYFSELNMISEDDESIEERSSRFHVSSMSGQGLNGSEFDSDVSYSTNCPSTNENNLSNETLSKLPCSK